MKGCENASDDITQQGHNREVIFDETKLDIQADILVDVACCVVRLGSEERGNLENTLEDAHHDLLIELWTLCQVGGAPKVVQLEDVCTAFSGRGNDFGCLYLCKIAARECTAEAYHSTRGQPQDSSTCRMTVGDSRVIELSADTRRYLALVQRHRW